MENFDSDHILNGILQNDYDILYYIFKSYYSTLDYFVNKNGGNAEDSNIIFQDAILFIYRRLKKESFKLEGCNFETYFFSVCKFIWLKRQYEKEKINIENIDNRIIDEIFNFDQDNSLKLRYEIAKNNFDKLSKNEKKLLELYYNKTNKKKILEIMGFSSTKELNIKLLMAKKHIKDLINKDPELKKIRSEIDFYIDKDII